MELNSYNLSKALQLCLSPNFSEREQGQNFLSSAKRCQNFFSSYLLQISTDSNMAKEIQQIAAIQLKNFIFKNWKISSENLNDTTNYTEIPQKDKEFIKSEILKIFPSLSVNSKKTNVKIFSDIIRFILKYEIEWKDFLNCVLIYLNSNESFDSIRFLSGVEIFYQMSRRYEFEIEMKRDLYNNCFDIVSEYLESFAEKYLSAVSYDISLLANYENNREVEILYKILKIFLRSIQLGLPSSLMTPNKFDKWMNICFYLMKLDFASNEKNPQFFILNNVPNTLDDLEFLRKNILWKIKYTCFDIVFKIYEKYSDPSKVGKKETKLKSFASHVEFNYSKSFFEIFIQTLFNSKDKYLHEEIYCLIYQFFQLILNRSNTANVKLLQLLEQNIQILIKDHLIFNNMLGPVELDLLRNNQRDFIYRQFDSGLEFESKRVAINKFILKLSEFKLKKKSKPIYSDCVYSYLNSSLEYIDNQLKENKTNNNLNSGFNEFYYVLLKESCVNLLESISNVIADYYSDNVQEFAIPKFIVGDMQINTGSYEIILQNSSLGFIQQISSLITYKDSNLIKYIAECTLMNLFSKNLEENLVIAVKSALTVPAILQSHPIVKEIFKPNLANLFSVFLKLMQILDLDELIKCLESLVTVYKEEVFEFSIELMKELINSLDRYIKDDSDQHDDNNPFNNNITGRIDNNNDESSSDIYNHNEFDVESNSSSNSSDESNTNSAFSFVLKTINRLISIASKREPLDVFYQLESIIYPVITWGLKSNNNLIFKEIIDIIYSIVSSNNAPMSNLTWSIYPELLKTLTICHNNNLEPSIGFDHLQEIITNIMSFIIKDPENFINQNNVRYIDITVNLIPDLITVSRLKINDEVNCSYVIKILIIILETYKGKIDYLLKDILSFVIIELKSAKQTVYKSILLQTIALSYVYDPKLTNRILEEMNITGHLFELWVDLISQMKFDFEYRRSLMAFASLMLIDNRELSPILRDNVGFIFNKIVFICGKLSEIRERNKGRDEVGG